MKIVNGERWCLPAALAKRGRAWGLAALVSVAAAAAASAACGGSTKPGTATPEPLAANATVAPAAPTAATPGTQDPGSTTATATPMPAGAESGKKAAKRDALAKIQITAGMVPRTFDRQNLPAGQVQLVTAQNDPDGQLGKPNQYTSRADFIDTTLVTGGDWSLAKGGAVEVFATTADAARAKKQLQTRSGGTSPSEVDYQSGPVLLRLSPRLSQPQIASYEKATKDTLKAAVKIEEGRKGNKKAAAAAATATSTPTP